MIFWCCPENSPAGRVATCCSCRGITIIERFFWRRRKESKNCACRVERVQNEQSCNWGEIKIPRFAGKHVEVRRQRCIFEVKQSILTLHHARESGDAFVIDRVSYFAAGLEGGADDEAVGDGEEIGGVGEGHTAAE